MIPSRILEKSKKFREIVIATPRNSFPWNSSMGISQFPEGCCRDASQILATYLYSELGIICNLILGTNGGMDNEIFSHAWLEFEGMVIDITADQFNRSGYNLDDVYVGFPTEWHESFFIQPEGDARHTSLNDKGSLDDVYLTILERL